MLDNPYDDQGNKGYEADHEAQGPNFLSELGPPQLTIRESAPARFEVKLDPGSGSKLHVEWFRDGERVHTGSRILSLCELGMAALVFQYVFAEDSGQYSCVVSTEYGQVQSNQVSEYFVYLCLFVSQLLSQSQILLRIAFYVKRSALLLLHPHVSFLAFFASVHLKTLSSLRASSS